VGKGGYTRGCALKVSKSGRDVVKKSCKPFPESEETVCTEGLHEALGRCFPKMFLEGGPIKISLGKVIIKRQKFVTLSLRKEYIGIAQEGAEVIERASEAHPLKVDEVGVSILYHNIL